MRATESPDIRKKLASASVGASNLLSKNLRRGTKQGADYNRLGKTDRETIFQPANCTDEAYDSMYRESMRGLQGSLLT